MKSPFVKMLALCLGFAVASISQSAQAANTADNVTNGQSDLTAAGTYSGGSPTTTSDVTFTNVTYSPTAFTLNTDTFNLSIGTLDDLDATQTLTINNTNGSGTSTIMLNGGSNSVASSTGDLLYVASGGTLSIGTASTGTLNLALAASGNFDIAGTANIGSVISGSGFGITKTGTGTLVLSGSNTYSGGTTLSAGTLTIGASSTPTSGTVTSGPLGTGMLTLSGGTLNFNGTSPFTVANAINATASTTTNVQVASGQNDVFNGNLTGSGNLNHTANGTTGQLQWGGDNSGYSGTYTQNSGNTSLTFNAATAGSSGAAWVFNNPTNQRTRLNFGAGTISFGSLSGNGSIANVAGSGLATVSVGALNTDTTFSGILGGSTGGQGQNIALTKVGTGTLALTGANTYTGGTIVNGGTLRVGAGGALNSSSGISVSNGATLENANGASITPALTLAEGSALTTSAASSAFAPTSLTLSGDLSDGWTAIALTATAGNGLTKGGALTLTLSGITAGTYSLTSGSGFSGAFSSANVNGNALTASGSDWTGTVGGFTYTYTNSTNVLQVVPEPGTFAMLLGGIGMLGLWQRARRRRA